MLFTCTMTQNESCDIPQLYVVELVVGSEQKLEAIFSFETEVVFFVLRFQSRQLS